jgi:hypothetical protein
VVATVDRLYPPPMCVCVCVYACVCVPTNGTVGTLAAVLDALTQPVTTAIDKVAAMEAVNSGSGGASALDARVQFCYVYLRGQMRVLEKARVICNRLGGESVGFSL